MSYDWRRDPSKPRVIRKVVRFYKNAFDEGRPKVARDYRIEHDMERVVARSARLCRNPTCFDYIEAGQPYAKVINRARPTGPIIKGKRLAESVDYHFTCVPEKVRPLVRFLYF